MMRDWLPHVQGFQEEILSLECYGMDTSCADCHKQKGGQYRCSDCFSVRLLCKDCCVKAHMYLPFHSISEWTGKYFQRTTLKALEFVLHLGHGGLSCPANGWMAKRGYCGTDITVVDVDGVYIHKVVWCGCANAPERWQQLLRMRLYPASIQLPQTAFTFRLLQYFNIDTLECGTSSASFMTKLKRLTNLYDPLSVPVSDLCFYKLWHIDIYL